MLPRPMADPEAASMKPIRDFHWPRDSGACVKGMSLVESHHQIEVRPTISTPKLAVKPLCGISLRLIDLHSNDLCSILSGVGGNGYETSQERSGGLRCASSYLVPVRSAACWVGFSPWTSMTFYSFAGTRTRGRSRRMMAFDCIPPPVSTWHTSPPRRI